MNLHPFVLSAAGLTLGLALLSAAGCSTVTPGMTDTVGRFDMVVDAPPATVARASDAVLESYKFPVESSSFTNVDGHIVAHTAQGAEIQVWVNPQDTNTSKVGIRIGMSGDEALSQQILQKIKARSTSTGATILGSIHGDSN